MKLRIWDRLNSSSEEATEKDFNYVGIYKETLRWEAESWVERCWGNNDYPSETQVQVDVVEGETVVASCTFIVRAETTVTFRGVLTEQQASVPG